MTVVRPPAVYGPHDLAFLPIFTAAARGLAIVPGDPAKRYSMIYAADLAAALLAAGGSTEAAGGVFYAAHAEILTLDDLIAAAERTVHRRVRRLGVPASLMHLVGRATDLVSQVTGRSSVLGSQRMREVAEGNWVCSPRALEMATGWAANVALSDGFQRTADWYRAEKLLP